MNRQKLYECSCVREFFPPFSGQRRLARVAWNETEGIDWYRYLWVRSVERGFSGMFGGAREML